MTAPRKRHGQAYWNLRRKIFAQRKPCHLCWQQIDYSLPSGHPRSAVLDHIIELVDGGVDSEANCAAACRVCNQDKENARRARNAGLPAPAVDDWPYWCESDLGRFKLSRAW